jgi:cell division protein FtsB
VANQFDIPQILLIKSMLLQKIIVNYLSPMTLYDFVKKNNITKSVFISYFIGVTAILYFLFSAFFGSKSLIKYFELKKEITNKDATKQELMTKMQNRQNMVDGMNLDSLDVDLLDEQARKVLGYANKNEVVIYSEKKKD